MLSKKVLTTFVDNFHPRHLLKKGGFHGAPAVRFLWGFRASLYARPRPAARLDRKGPSRAVVLDPDSHRSRRRAVSPHPDYVGFKIKDWPHAMVVVIDVVVVHIARVIHAERTGSIIRTTGD